MFNVLFANVSNVKLKFLYFTAQMHWFKQENQLQGNIFNFSQNFCLILPQKILSFEKVQIKIVNAVIFGKKSNASALQETNLFFILA